MTESLDRMVVGGGGGGAGAGDTYYSSPAEQYKITPLSTTQDSGQIQLIEQGLLLQIIIITSINLIICQPTTYGRLQYEKKSGIHTI